MVEKDRKWNSHELLEAYIQEQLPLPKMLKRFEAELEGVKNGDSVIERKLWGICGAYAYDKQTKKRKKGEFYKPDQTRTCRDGCPLNIREFLVLYHLSTDKGRTLGVFTVENAADLMNRNFENLRRTIQENIDREGIGGFVGEVACRKDETREQAMIRALVEKKFGRKKRGRF